MKFEIISRVNVAGMKIMDTYVHEFPDDSNVFGRVYDYRQRMYKMFPGCEFEMVEAKEIK